MPQTDSRRWPTRLVPLSPSNASPAFLPQAAIHLTLHNVASARGDQRVRGNPDLTVRQLAIGEHDVALRSHLKRHAVQVASRKPAFACCMNEGIGQDDGLQHERLASAYLCFPAACASLDAHLFPVDGATMQGAVEQIEASGAAERAAIEVVLGSTQGKVAVNESTVAPSRTTPGDAQLRI